MSKQKAFAVRDSKTALYHFPFFTNTHADAERSFIATVNNAQTTINQFPEDFDLYHIGAYDQETGIMHPLDTPTHMLKAVAVIQKGKLSKVEEMNH